MWFEKSRNEQDHRYAPIDLTAEDQSQHPPRTASSLPWIYIITTTCIVTIVAVVSFFAGTSFARREKYWRPDLPTVQKALQPDTSFMVQPNNVDDHTWDSMFPSSTFFPHPDIAPERGTLSVFHQLHCLNAIRHIYWATVDPNHHKRDGAGPGDPAFDKWHMNHCIELLRQSLMCNADLTLEVTNKTLGGVTGFGTKHVCVDWEGLLKWVDETEENAIDHAVSTHP
ncbi:hypothetical protein DPSP01_005737 [Paraphaeosphaeria sporulosa]|uniref:Tat pathway signal sequence n=1 Tax=Paraphaeosphaeria sporulosa TaxID=1460663 RepID=A0A177CCK4_9PLEO|nr:uncharacterized protein CC84DRAFT_1217982 [Paraphaeosphaeria sporulosa]OAG04537.1 hypothetical protein CC84DRAFT_1217982 [Paraphaeosphaeria sporulosa]